MDLKSLNLTVATSRPVNTIKAILVHTPALDLSQTLVAIAVPGLTPEINELTVVCVFFT